MSETELTCGQELAASAEVPEAIGALLKHVSVNMDAHARWVGVETNEAKVEGEVMSWVAAEYRALGEGAERLAQKMRSFEQLAASPHDPKKMDWVAFGVWMRKKIELQRHVANLLLSHAAESEVALKHLEGRA
jgi:hypothetical protein